MTKTTLSSSHTMNLSTLVEGLSANQLATFVIYTVYPHLQGDRLFFKTLVEVITQNRKRHIPMTNK